MSIRKMFFILGILVCSACSSDLFISHRGNYPSQESIAKVHSGQTKEQVLDILSGNISISKDNDKLLNEFDDISEPNIFLAYFVIASIAGFS